MPLPIKQYKHMFKDVKFLATTAQPSYREVSHWIDLLEDPTGGTIKVWNGAGWKKISGEGDSDTGLVIGDTTGTAYDGGKGKELETAMDQVHATTNELQDTISSLQTEIESKKIFQFSYVDLQNKTEDFVQRFFDAVSSRIFGPPTNTIFLYNHGRDDFNGQMNLYMTVSDYHFSVGQPITIIFYSTIYHDKDSNRDQFVKLTATISTNDLMDNPTFEIEEVPVDLNSTIGLDSFYVFPKHKLVNGAVLTEDEYSDLLKAVNGQKTAWFKNNFMGLSKNDDTDTIYFGVNTSYIDNRGVASDDDYLHVFISLTGSIDTQRTVHISDEYNKEGSLCYVYGKNSDIMFIPSFVVKQGTEKLMEAMNMANIPIFLDYFGSEDDDAIPYSSFSNIASLHQGDMQPLISSNIISTSEDAINIEAQSRYLTGTDDTFNISKTVLKQIELKLSGDGTKFLSDNGTYKEIDLSSKQDTLVSGTNIKTINNQSLLGNGNIDISAGDSKVYVFELSKYITSLSGEQRFTGTIPDEAYTALNDALTDNKLILGHILVDGISALVPLTIFTPDDTSLCLTGNLYGRPVVMLINSSSKEYTAYYNAESIEANDSTVTVSPLLDEMIVIFSRSPHTLSAINVESYMIHFRLDVQTSSQSVMLDVDGLNGVIGAKFTGSRIALEANSRYEIDVEAGIAVVAKINTPQAM